MPWKETCVMNLKMQLIGDWLGGQYSVTDLSRGYGVSRKTVYKWLARYEQHGPAGLAERSHAPPYCPHGLGEDIAQQIIKTKQAHPSFGPKKVMDYLRTRESLIAWPADSTAGELLKRVGLVKKRRYKRPYPADSQPLHWGGQNNALWSVGYKGQYPSSNGQWCYPLTISDNASRYLLRCTALTRTTYAQAQPVCEWAFREHGLPEGILSDNGPPFASRAAGGLTRLSLWWIQLGIRVHRSHPGCPTQNARHERIHGSLNRAVGDQLRRACPTTQQQILYRFKTEYNEVRSHESLGRQTPASVYTPSERRYSPIIKPIEYDSDQQIRTVRHNGEIRLNGRLVYISELVAKQPVGLRPVDNDRLEVRFSFHLLGYINMTTYRLEPATGWHGAEPLNV